MMALGDCMVVYVPSLLLGKRNGGKIGNARSLCYANLQLVVTNRAKCSELSCLS